MNELLTNWNRRLRDRQENHRAEHHPEFGYIQYRLIFARRSITRALSTREKAFFSIHQNGCRVISRRPIPLQTTSYPRMIAARTCSTTRTASPSTGEKFLFLCPIIPLRPSTKNVFLCYFSVPAPLYELTHFVPLL